MKKRRGLTHTVVVVDTVGVPVPVVLDGPRVDEEDPEVVVAECVIEVPRVVELLWVVTGPLRVVDP